MPSVGIDVNALRVEQRVRLNGAMQFAMRSAEAYAILDGGPGGGGLWDEGGCLIAAGGIRKWLDLPADGLAAVRSPRGAEHYLARCGAWVVDADGFFTESETLAHWDAGAHFPHRPTPQLRLDTLSVSAMLDEAARDSGGVAYSDSAASAVASLLERRLGRASVMAVLAELAAETTNDQAGDR
jgi:hypothetical protein